MAAAERDATHSGDGTSVAKYWASRDEQPIRGSADVNRDNSTQEIERHPALFGEHDRHGDVQPRHLRYYSMHAYRSQAWLHPRSLYYHGYFH
jgi:hypothetical protein